MWRGLVLAAALLAAAMTGSAQLPSPMLRADDQQVAGFVLPYSGPPEPGGTLWASFSAAYAEGTPTNTEATLVLTVHECKLGQLVERWSRTVPLPVPGQHRQPLLRVGTGIMTEGFLLRSTLTTPDGWSATESHIAQYIAASGCFA